MGRRPRQDYWLNSSFRNPTMPTSDAGKFLSLHPLLKLPVPNLRLLSQTALGVFLQGTNAQEQANRLSMEELEEALGDQLVPLRKEPNEYSMCFI